MTTNDITGDALRTRPATDAYRDGYDAIDFSAHRQIESRPMLDESEWRGWCALRGSETVSKADLLRKAGQASIEVGIFRQQQLKRSAAHRCAVYLLEYLDGHNTSYQDRRSDLPVGANDRPAGVQLPCV